MQDPSGPMAVQSETNTPTVLVLTPSVGGSFFERILNGLMREVVTAGGRLVAIETRQKFSDAEEEGRPGDFATPVGWRKADGVVTVTTAVGQDYVQRASAADKPVVLVSSPQYDDSSHLVRPDNQIGARMAVNHLVEHGHTRIGFVGNRAHHDVRERFEGVQETLESHGLKLDPRLVYRSPNNSEAGGGVAAQSFLDSDVRPTALVVATDANAIGFIASLSDAGLRVPSDLAIIAFDNDIGATLETPTLSTVELRFDDLGALAGRTVLSAIDGEQIPDGTLSPGSAVLMCRDSCGCGADTRYGGQADADSGDRATHKDDFQRRLTEVLETELFTGDLAADERTAATISQLVRDAVEMLELGNGATAARIRSFTTLLLRVASRPDMVRRIVNVMTEHAPRLASDNSARDAAGAAVPSRIAAALWKAQSTALLWHTDAYNEAIAEQFAVDADMLAPSGSDAHDLGWLASTSAKAGVLALWNDDEPGGALTVVGEYHDSPTPLNLIGSEVMAGDFPPEVLVALASPAKREICVVVPVLTPEKDWGLLAAVVPIDPRVVRDTHQHWAAMLSAALESQSRQEEVRRSTLFDGLTGLPNRQLFTEQLEQAIREHKNDGTAYSVLFLDLDGFKLINDSLGHQMGDRVLKKVATELRGTLRSVDTPARLGGDEFVVLLADTEADCARAAAQRIQAALDNVFVVDGHEILIRASIGIASSAVEYASTDAVLRDADAAMYRAKSVAPGTIEHFDAPMRESKLRRSSLAQDVLSAIEGNEFEVHYQPIVNLETGRTDRFEALARWRHPIEGLIEPKQFLQVIKETSLILQLGHRVLDEVCRQLAEWGPRVTNVSINISEKEFWSQHLLARVLEALERHGVAPERLTLEITEATLMRRPELALRLMNQMHEAGIALHIDNFGTGYSSVEMLSRFPITAFKIDQSFIHKLNETENGPTLITSLLKLGKALGMSVVAEGVETEEQRSLLQSLGCATGQGYLFLPAVTAQQAGALVDSTLPQGVPDEHERASLPLS